MRAKVPGAHTGELRQALAAGARLKAEGDAAGQPVTAVLERLAAEVNASGVDALLRLAPGAELPLGALLDLRLERLAIPDSIALPFSALHGGDRIFVVEEGRLRGVPIERIGELAPSGGEAARVLVRAPGIAAGTRVMVTHLLNALDSLRVETLQ